MTQGGLDLAALLRPGMTVFVQGSVGQPLALLAELQRVADRIGGLRIISPMTPGLNAFPQAGGKAESRFVTFFDYRELRQSWQAGPIEFVPLHYSEIGPYLRAAERIHVALIQLAPPDEEGWCSTGLSADFVPDVLERCDLVVAEFNRAMPVVADAPRIALSRIDHAIHVDRPLPVARVPGGDPVSDAIAGHVAELVRDGDTIQFGVGKLPQRAAAGLGGKTGLGLHNGLTSPVVRSLIESGAMTGARKSRDAGKHVTGAVCGDADFYDWVAGHPDFAIRPTSYTHAADVLAAIDNLVAINAVLEVDLFGQANAEMAGGRQISGSGGLLDFVRGARRSKGGRAILCVASTRGDGQHSNIVARLGGVVTVARTDIDFVVTEHGVARLAHLSVDDRAAALIAIAAPAFRDHLKEEWAQARRA